MISISGQPLDEYNPVYTPIKYYLDSDNKTENNFRYLVQVYDNQSDLMFEKLLIPDINNREGILDVHRLLQDYVSHSFDTNFFNGPSYDAPNSYKGYSIQLGEEYKGEWEWDDYGFGDSNIWINRNNAAINPSGNNRTILFTSDPSNEPPYSPGDTVNITLNAGTQDAPNLEGPHKVLDVQLASGSYSTVEWFIVLDIPWVGSGTSTGGSSTYSDGRRFRFENLLELSDLGGINSTFKPVEFNNIQMSDYYLKRKSLQPVVFYKLLTDLPLEYKIRELNPLLIQYMSLETDGANQPRWVEFENSNGYVTRKELRTDFTDFTPIRIFDVGLTRFDWGTPISGSGPMIDDSVDWYQFKFLDGDLATLTQTYTLTIDRKCDLTDNTVSLMFMDSKGSFIPYSFLLRNEETINIDRSNMTTYNGKRTPGGSYNVDTLSGGNTTFHSESYSKWYLRTGFLNNTESVFFENLIKSPVTFIKIGTSGGVGDWRRCVINTPSLGIKRGSQGQLKRYEVDITLSNKTQDNI